MGIRKMILNWCPRPPKRSPITFTKLVISICALTLIGGFILTAYIAIAFLPPIAAFTPNPWSLYPPPAEEAVVGVYMNETGELIHVGYSYTGTIQARKFQVIIDSFSKELTLLTDRTYEETYSDPWEGRPVSWSAKFLAPNKPGKHEIIVRYIVFQDPVWLSKREYKQKVTIIVEPIPYKPPPEELLKVALDKIIYRQEENMTIEIRNISKDTLYFSLNLEKFDPKFNDWSYHISLISGSIKPGETFHTIQKLNAETFPPGQYRVFINGVYAEFEVKPP